MTDYCCPFIPDKFYHAFNHAIGFDDLFKIEENYHYFHRRLIHYLNPVANLYCYNFLPNHFHLFFQIKSQEELLNRFDRLNTNKSLQEHQIPELVLQQFGNFFNSYTKSFNAWHNRQGRLFRATLKRSEINTEDYFTKIIHYIHANAAQHGFCKKVEDWKHSSYHEILSDQPTALKRTEIFNWFGGREQFIQFHQQPVHLKIKEF